MKRLSIGIIAYKTVNIAWLKQLSEKLDAHIVVCIGKPQTYEFSEYCNSYLLNRERISFGKNRKLSMILASELGEECIVTDGDGQYSVDSIKKVANELLKDEFEAIIPQRINRMLILRIGDQVYDRSQLELFENLCIFDQINKKGLDFSKIDLQPGMFGFKGSICKKILPYESDWLTDLDISIKVINKTKYKMLPLSIDEKVQEKSLFSIKDQKIKFLKLSDIFDVNLREVFIKHEKKINIKERKLIKNIIDEIEG
jgi:hypothetical protein